MIYYVAMLAYGDNLISLSLLEKISERNRIVVLGTGLTETIGRLMSGGAPTLVKVFESVPCFFDIRKCGLRAAFRDQKRFSAQLKDRQLAGAEFIFEKRDLRNRILLTGLRPVIFEPKQEGGVYQDRGRLLQQIFRQKIPIQDCAWLTNRVRSVVINPASRILRKAIDAATLQEIIRYFSRHAISISLLDPDGRHSDLRHAVDSYFARTTLTEAVELLKKTDLYIGADSLLIHFAYYLRVPFITIYRVSGLYFAPPGVASRRNYIEMDGDANISKELDRLLGQAT